ncbi:hypothetical protein BGY98DRAFT_143816 [Russula aff. rugulosa BPL654]|nr:hypothetical protein BGY98DRAFT_143816 [Russula aff. rugulosa BPL654]
MISKSFPIQAFVALLIVTSSLTSPVNAAAIARGPFSRDLRRGSVPAPVMARFIEERQQTTTTTNCSTVVFNCLFGGTGLACESPLGSPSPPGTFSQCLINNCPEASRGFLSASAAYRYGPEHAETRGVRGLNRLFSRTFLGHIYRLF